MHTDTSIPLAPRSLPLLGHALPLTRDPLRFFTSLPDRGPMVRLRMGPRSVVMVCDPVLTRQVLLEDRVFDKGGPLFDRVGEVLGNGLITCPHSQHRRQRRLCQPSFHPARFAGYADTTASAAGSSVGEWHDGQVFDVLRELMAMTAHATTQTMFSTTLSVEARREFVEDLTPVLEGIFRRMVTPPFLERVPSARTRRYLAARDRSRGLVTRIAVERRTDGTDHGDLLSALVGAVDPDSLDGRSRLNDTELADEVLTFLAAGTETTAVTLTWALYLLARHPEIEAGIHEEVDRVLGGAAPTYADLPALERIGRVITETLRLYPPTWLLTRVVAKDTELGGTRLPAGTTLAFSPYLLHHRPDLFPDPDVFDPDRWITARPDRTAYLPFGAGPRKCIGDRLALIQAPLILASIAARWRLRPIDDRAVRPSLRATLAPHGLRMRVAAREPAADSVHEA